MRIFRHFSREQFLLLMLLLTAMTFVLLQYQQESYSSEQDYEEKINQLHEVDATLDLVTNEIVSLRVVNYDDVNDLMDEFKTLRSYLHEIISEVGKEGEAERYYHLGDRELALVEKIKSTAAVVRNALLYIPGLLTEIETTEGDISSQDRNAALLMVNHIYNFTLFSLEIDRMIVESELNDFSEQLINHASSGTKMANLLKHLRQTVSGVGQLRQLQQQYHEIESHRILEQIRATHEQRQLEFLSFSRLRINLLLGLMALLLLGLWWLAVSLNRSRQTLAREHRRLQDAVDSMPEGFLLFDGEHRLQIFNQRIVEFYPWLREILKPGCSEEQWLQGLGDSTQSQRLDLEGEPLADPGRENSSYYERTRDGRWLLINRSSTAEGGMVSVHIDITHSKNIEQSLRRMEHALHQSPIAIVITDLEGLIEYVNPKFEQVSGYRSEEVIGLTPRVLKSGDMSADNYRQMWETIAAGGEWHGEFHNRRKDGTLYWERASISGVLNDRGEIVNYIAVKEDITHAKELSERMGMHVTVFNTLSEGMMVTDSIGTIRLTNPAFFQITGYEAAEVIGRNASILRSGRQDDHFYEQMWAALHDHGKWSGEIWNRRKDGTIYPQWLSIAAIVGEMRQYVAVFTDLTERKAVEERLSYRENHDLLTGLPNRALLRDRIEHRIAMMNRDQRRLALLFIDLDRFKGINDTYGHSLGDELLKNVAARLLECVRSGDTVSRFGSDEFVVLLEDLEDVEDAALVANKIITSISQPFPMAVEELYIGASIGIALYPEDAHSAESLISNADIAMSQAKGDGRNRYHFFTDEMQKQVGRRLELEKELRKAVLNGEMELYYQPVVAVASGEVFGVESLIRWNHPTMGLVSPGIFIPLAEESDIIGALSVWVLQAACEQGIQWEADTEMPALDIAINLSCAQFEQGGGVGAIASIIEASGYPTDRLTMEITESLLMGDKEHGAKLFLDLKGLGVKLSIDDFGTGYSSLSYLKHFPVDTLKIDRSFIGQLREGGTDEALVRAIIAMGKNLGLKLVAEGVEGEEQLALLQQLECDYIQGFYYSRPLPATAFKAWLLDYNRTLRTLNGPGQS